MNKVIVTGGAGFIGSHLVQKLLELGYAIVVLDNFSTGKKENLLPFQCDIVCLEKNLADFDSLLSNNFSELKDAKYFFHLASLPRIARSIDNPLETHQSNVTGTLTALELAKKLRVKKFIYTSSSSIYGYQKTLPISEENVPNPKNPYAAQKLMGEMYCKIYSSIFQLPAISFRLFNVYGNKMDSGGGYKLFFSTWMDQKRRGLPLSIYGDGLQTRDFTHVSDVVEGLIAGMKQPQKNQYEIFNLGAGRQVTVNDLGKLFDSPVVHLSSKEYEEKFKEADISKAKKELNWTPKTSIEEGVKQLLLAEGFK